MSLLSYGILRMIEILWNHYFNEGCWYS